MQPSSPATTWKASAFAPCRTIRKRRLPSSRCSLRAESGLSASRWPLCSPPDPYRSEDAAELVFVDYEPLPALADMEAALAADAPRMHPGWHSNKFVERQMAGGDIDAARQAASHVVARTYTTHRQAGVPMECRGVVAEVDSTGRWLTVHSSTQIPHLLRTYLADELGWPESRLRVRAPEVGGGFGVKGHVFVEEVLVAWLAIRIGRPVKWIEDRREHLIASIHAREHRHVLEAYVDADGRLLGLEADISVDTGAYSVWPFTASSDAGMVAKVLPGPYDFQAYRATFRAVATNKCPLGTYRGVGRPSAVFSQERLMDEIALELGLDAVEIRRRNVIRQFPYRNALGITYDPGSYSQSLERVAELLAPERAAAAANGVPDRRTGVGLALYVEQSGHGTPDFTRRRVPIETGYESARVEMAADGRVVVFTGLQCHGQGHETTLAQVAADELGVEPEDIEVIHGDTLTAPYSVGTWGSRGAVLGGGSVRAAAAQIREKLLAIAAQHLQALPDELDLAGGQARRRDRRDASVPISLLARWANRKLDNLPSGMAPGLVGTAFVDGPPGRHLFERLPRRGGGGGHAHRTRAREAIRRRRRLRHRDQSDHRRRPGARRRHAGNRFGPARAIHLRRGGPASHDELRRLPHAERHGYPGYRDSSPGDALAAHAPRHEGDGRRGRNRACGGNRQCDCRCARRPGQRYAIHHEPRVGDDFAAGADYPAFLTGSQIEGVRPPIAARQPRVRACRHTRLHVEYTVQMHEFAWSGVGRTTTDGPSRASARAAVAAVTIRSRD